MKYLKKMYKNCLVYLLVLILCMSMLPAVDVSAETKTIKISSVNDLIRFSEKVNEGNNYAGYTILLTKDLEFNGTEEFKPIGHKGQSTTYCFSGTFDGQNHTIRGLYIKGTISNNIICMGLFGMIVDGTVKNLYLEDCNFESMRNQTGGIAGYLFSGTIENCHFLSGTVKIVNSTNNKATLGGVAGYALGKIINCSSAAVLEGGGEQNGIACVAPGRDGSIYNSCFTGTGTDKIKGKNCYLINADCDMGIYYDKFGNSSSLEKDFMQSDEFLLMLNQVADKVSEWKSWEFRDEVSQYPIQVKDKLEQEIMTTFTKKTYKASELKKTKKTFLINASANTKLTYKTIKGSPYISCTNAGKVTIKKGTPKGTYKIKITAGENGYYKSAYKTVTITIK